MSGITPEFEYIRDLVRERTALVLTDDKSYLVETRLHRIAVAQGSGTVSALLKSLKSQPFGSVHQQVVDALMTHETLFFRDQWPFEELEKHIFPYLRAERQHDKTLNIWSAACSTGQEAYSIAMVAAGYGWSVAGFDIKILATDVSRQVLERTREGRYTEMEVTRGLSPAQKSRFFVPSGSDWVAKPQLRSMIETRHLNLADSWWGLPSMDVVFLRNVLIYFDVKTRRGIFEKLHRLIKPDGFLFLGGSEATMDFTDLFERDWQDGLHFFRPRRA